MTLLAPGFLFAAGLVAAVVVGLHLLSTRLPKTESFPTVRFVPDVPVRATTLTIRPSDLLLLLLRVLTILVIGLAFAGPRLSPARETVLRVLAVDASRAVATPNELVDSARAYLSGAATLVVFDSTAREIERGIADTVSALAAPERWRNTPRGVLSAALIASVRAGVRLRDRTDSVELVVVSPFVGEERDAATDTLRRLWPGPIILVPIRAATGPLTSRPSLQWADSTPTDTWRRRTKPDGIGAVRAGGAVLVFPFERRWQLASNAPSGSRVWARWSDGEPAGIETRAPNGCQRSIGITLPIAGDVTLRPDYDRFLAAIFEPCGGARDLSPLAPELMGLLRGDVRPTSAGSLPRRVMRVAPIAPWLFGAGLLLVVGELLARRAIARRGARQGAAEHRARKVA